MSFLLPILLLLAPTYVWRFAFGPIKTDLLEVLVLVIWAIFFWTLWQKKQLQDFWNWFKNISRTLLILVGLFLLAAIVATIISPNHSRALGLLVAYFIQPIATFFAAAYIFRNPRARKIFASSAFLLIGLMSAYAIVQYFTLLGLPHDYWGNSAEPKRAIGFFNQPDLFALFLTPLLAFCLSLVSSENFKNIFYKICFGLGLIGLLLSLSRGGWLAFLAAVLFFVYFSANKKIRKAFWILTACTALIVAVVPNLRYRVILPFMGEKSTVSRFSLANTAWKMIQSSPVLGKGLYGFKTYFDQYNTDPGLVSLNYPHNIFLNFWVEFGLLGMFSFFGLLIYFVIRAWRQKENPYYFGVLLFIIAMFVHGLVDIPYLNNALSLEFWLFMALLV